MNADISETVVEYLIKALVLFTAMPVHEFAHGLAADKLGDKTAREQGRLTLNPFAHLTLWGSVMLIFAGFGWGKPVPVDSRNLKKPKRDMMLISLAGPASNLVMAYLMMVAYKAVAMLSAVKGGAYDDAAMVLIYIMLINVSLGVFNFLPIPPLDGSKIFGAVLPQKWYFTIMKYEQYIFIALIVLLYTGLLSIPLEFLRGLVIDAMDILTRWVEKLMLIIIAGDAA